MLISNDQPEPAATENTARVVVTDSVERLCESLRAILVERGNQFEHKALSDRSKPSEQP